MIFSLERLFLLYPQVALAGAFASIASMATGATDLRPQKLHVHNIIPTTIGKRSLIRVRRAGAAALGGVTGVFDLRYPPISIYAFYI